MKKKTHFFGNQAGLRVLTYEDESDTTEIERFLLLSMADKKQKPVCTNESTFKITN